MPKTGKNSACKKTAIATRQLIESSPLQPTAGSRYLAAKTARTIHLFCLLAYGERSSSERRENPRSPAQGGAFHSTDIVPVQTRKLG